MRIGEPGSKLEKPPHCVLFSGSRKAMKRFEAVGVKPQIWSMLGGYVSFWYLRARQDLAYTLCAEHMEVHAASRASARVAIVAVEA